MKGVAVVGVWLVAAAASAAGQQAPGPLAPSETIVTPGLLRPVEILVDPWGVPHVYAQSQDDLFLAQGWNAARDRLWQIDLWKRRGEGLLSEAFGPRFVEQDRAARLLLYRGELHREWLAYAEDTKRIVTAFVAGINAYVALTEREPERLPVEFRLLGYRPSRWSPETVVRLRSHGLLRNVEKEVWRARLLREHGPAALALADRLEPAHALAIPEGLELQAIPDDVLGVYDLGTAAVTLEPEQLRALAGRPPVAAGPLVAPAVTLLAAAGRGEGLGSNNWALAPSRTTTGRAILANDPHRGLAVPSLRYLVHLSAPGFDAVGAGEPALPGISIGHNGRIAFGLTIFAIDQEDLYVYRTNPAAPDEYEYRGRFEPMRVVRERIPVRGAPAAEVTLKFTRHGPVLHEDVARGRAYSLRAAWLEPGGAPYLASLAYMRARDWDGFLAAMNRWGLPAENQVFADTAGHIGWKPGGFAPIRPNWDGLLPVPGDGRYEWAGLRDMDELPVSFDPPEGFVATANQMNLPVGYPHALGYEWAPPYRHERIRAVLGGSAKLGLRDSLALQADSVSLPARRLKALVGALPSRPEADLLRVWDGSLGTESAGAALFEVWLTRHLRPAVVARVLATAAAREAVGDGDLEQVLSLLERPDARLGPDPVAARDGLLLETLAAAAAECEKRLGPDWSTWRWGSLHHAQLEHPLLPVLPDALAAAAVLGPLPRGGSGATPLATPYRREDFRQTSGASFRVVLDVGDWDASLAMNAPGQAGDPRSPHFGDLFEPWAADDAFPLLYTRERVEEAATLRIRLEPRAAP